MTSDLETTRTLAGALRDHLSGRQRPPAVFEEIALSGDWTSRGRLDIAAITVKPNYAGILVDGYELKVSRADFTRDVEAMKWRKYLDVCDRLIFATPAGLVTKDEIPDGAGLIVYTAKGTWQTVVRAPRHDQTGRDDAQLLMRTIWRRARNGTDEDRDDRASRLRRYEQLADADLAKRLSRRVARMIHDARDQQTELKYQRQAIEDAQARLTRQRLRAKEAPDVLEALDQVLAVAKDAFGASEWATDQTVTAARRALTELTDGLHDRTRDAARKATREARRATS